MCQRCDEGMPQDHTTPLGPSRRDFLKASSAAAVSAAGMSFLSASPAEAKPDGGPPADTGARRRRYVIRGGHVMSMDPQVGDFAQGDVLVEGTKIVAVGPNLKPGAGAGVMDATGCIVMLLGVDLNHLRRQLEASRDHVFAAAGIAQNVFGQ